MVLCVAIHPACKVSRIGDAIAHLAPLEARVQRRHNVPMSDTIRFRVAYRSSVVRVREAICRPHDQACGTEEISDSHSIVFVRRGLFVRHLSCLGFDICGLAAIWNK